MIGTIMQQNLIEKLNKYLDINNSNAKAIINWIKSEWLSTNTTNVEIELKDYINLLIYP